MKKYLFQITLAGFFATFMFILAFVTYVAYQRDSGYAGMDMKKVHKMRLEASAK